MNDLYDTTLVFKSSSKRDLERMRRDFYRIAANAPSNEDFHLKGESYASFYFLGDWTKIENVSERVRGGFTDVFPCEGGYSFKSWTQDRGEPAVAMWKVIADKYYPGTELFYCSEPNVPLSVQMTEGYTDTRRPEDRYCYDPDNLLECPDDAMEKAPDDYVFMDKPVSETSVDELRTADIERQFRKFNRGMGK